MKKRLSLILALSVLIPSFAQAGSKKFHAQHQAIQHINQALNNNADYNVQNELAKLTPNQRSFYSHKINQGKQRLIKQSRDFKQERFERAERNRINRERNRRQVIANAQNKNKNSNKSETLTQQVAGWFKNNPFSTLITLAALTAGGYKLYQLFNKYYGNSNNQNQRQNQDNEQVDCLLCEQQVQQNQTVRLACHHTFCGNCLHGWVQRNRDINRKCPVRTCSRHLCSNQCRRTINNNAECDDLIQPLLLRINTARQNQRIRLNNQNNQAQPHGNLQNQPQQQGGIWQTLLSMGTNAAMRYWGV